MARGIGEDPRRSPASHLAQVEYPASREDLVQTAEDNEAPPEVIYNAVIPPESFDFIIVDECHRSIYELWSQVLLYFDAFTVGLTATPAGKTIGFFNQNLIMQYGHDEAVTDGVNVDFDVYRQLRGQRRSRCRSQKIRRGFYLSGSVLEQSAAVLR